MMLYEMRILPVGGTFLENNEHYLYFPSNHHET